MLFRLITIRFATRKIIVSCSIPLLASRTVFNEEPLVSSSSHTAVGFLSRRVSENFMSFRCGFLELFLIFLKCNKLNVLTFLVESLCEVEENILFRRDFALRWIYEDCFLEVSQIRFHELKTLSTRRKPEKMSQAKSLMCKPSRPPNSKRRSLRFWSETSHANLHNIMTIPQKDKTIAAARFLAASRRRCRGFNCSVSVKSELFLEIKLIPMRFSLLIDSTLHR